MPIYLRAPAHRPGGPDGQGWNRLSLNCYAEPAGQCALRPTSYPTLFESFDTRRARWGSFGACVAAGECSGCAVLAARRSPRRTLESSAGVVLVRVRDEPITAPDALVQQFVEVPYVMADPDIGWSAQSERWTWDDLAGIQGWVLGRAHRDQHGEGFWLWRLEAGDAGD